MKKTNEGRKKNVKKNVGMKFGQRYAKNISWVRNKLAF
jgi:hypothetical protein